MEKPCDQRGRLICLNLLLIIVWQFSGHPVFIFHTAAAPDATPAPAPAPTPAADPNRGLPSAEVSSMNNVIYALKAKTAISTIVTDYCKNQMTDYGHIVRCNCGKKECHIVEVSLSGLELSGTIDAGIGDLWKATSIPSCSVTYRLGNCCNSSGYTIILSNNKLHGPIPDSLGNLHNLVTLDLSNNQLSGTIPDNLGNMKALQFLFLQKNFLEGGIPSSLGYLNKLENMVLYSNMLSGSLPNTLENLVNLQYLTLADNRLSGTLPNGLTQLVNLLSFWVSSNYFLGELPDFKNLRFLRWFNVAGNQLTGPLPDTTNWDNLQYLALQGNNFDGPLREEYFQRSKLEIMIITDLVGGIGFNIPKDTNLPKLSKLVLRKCSLSGPIPDFVGELSTLKHLDLSFNKLTGKVPESMRSSLIYLSLASNNINGTIPSWIYQAKKTRIDLSYNNLSTMDIPIPSDLDLNLFACCCCGVSSTIKPYMLQPAAMAKEYFNEKPRFHNLFINSGGGQTHFNESRYDADNNTSPFYISPMQNWAYTFSGDFLAVTTNSSDYTKRVPCRISDSETSLYDDARLSPVSLDYYGFGLLHGLYEVTLHFAEIVYVDDADYGILRKRIFDIYVQGKQEMKDFDITAHAGGPNKATTVPLKIEINETHPLLDIHLYWAGKGSFLDFPSFNGPLIAAISVKSTFDIEDKKLSAWQIALITLASLVAMLLLLLALAWWMGWLGNQELKKRVKVAEFRTSDNLKQEQKVELKELVAATGSFSSEKCIGKGYVGAVYKAEVLSHNVTVAVKRINPRRISPDLRKEIYLLTALEGQNIVKLLDVHFGEKLQLFIYEYMEKESLETALFNSKVGTILWKTRFEICKGIATGLAYLHQRSTRIVHGNLKASNILLDKDDKPKLSDFGCASIYSSEADKFSLIKQNGQSGVLAPEYCQGRDNALSAKTDIYSFGVILLEIVAGHGNKESKGTQETIDLLDKVQLHFQGKKPSISGFIDKKLKGDKDLNEREVELVLELAVMCTSSPSVRPWMHDVLSVLNGEKKLDEIRPVLSPSPSNDVDDTPKSSASTSSK